MTNKDRRRTVSRKEFVAAAIEGNELKVQDLITGIDRPYNAEATARTFNHALAAASCFGHSHIVKFLTESSVSADAINKPDGSYLALCEACADGHEDIAKMLITNGTSIPFNPSFPRDYQPLEAAAGRGCIAIVKLLIAQYMESEVID